MNIPLRKAAFGKVSDRQVSVGKISVTFKLLIVALLSLGFVACSSKPVHSPLLQEGESGVAYSLGLYDQVVQIYPDPSWLPAPYQPYYSSLEDTIQFYTESSLQNDGIAYDSVTVWRPSEKGQVFVIIRSDDPAVNDYGVMHPAFIKNYQQALIGIEKCQADSGCWNKGNTHPDEPWAFFPQFSMAMALQKSVLLLNYPPASALTTKSYLDTFTMKRWARVLQGAGVTQPTLFEVIVDVRPIAAPASGTSQYLPDATTYFNDPTHTSGGYYISPQLGLMLDPPSNQNANNTLPLVVLGSPARETWCDIINKSGTDCDVLATGRVTLAGSQKSTPYILGNHPTVSTYQCCKGSTDSQCTSFDLIQDEQIDYQVTCWVNSMSADPSQDPVSALATCNSEWVSAPSTTNQTTLCTSAAMDNNACYGDDITQQQAAAYCAAHNNQACPTTSSGCPVTDAFQ